MGNDDSTLPSKLTDEDDEEVESWLQEAAQISQVSERDLEAARLPAIGTVVGDKYRLEELLGQGGMGAVFRCTHLVSEKQVALKWMLRSATNEAAMQRFIREARAAGRIDDPNVVDVYDIGQEGGSSYLVMELLRGVSLRDRIKRGPMTGTEAVDTLIPAMRGVAAAHREGVIHRDLKPDNIFLCTAPDGSPREAKVLDFGVSAVAMKSDSEDSTLTKEGAILGTPSYMSPEQLQSAKGVEAPTDVYAFGVILYETLSGKLPFEADSYAGLVLAIANTAPTPLRDHNPDVPKGLERVVMKAMAANKDARHADISELIQALRPFGRISTGSGTHPGLAAAPSPKGAVPLVFVGLLIAVLGGLAWVFAGEDEVPEPSEAERIEPDSQQPAQATAPVVQQPAPMPAPVPAPPAPAAPEPAPAAVVEPAHEAVVPRPVPKRPVAKKGFKPAARPKPKAAPIPAPSPAGKKARSGRISLDQL